MKRILACLLLGLLAAGCATRYHAGDSSGFSDARLASDLFRVNFNGNRFTSPEQVQDYALLHASEVVLKNGFTYFTVLDARQCSRLVYSPASAADMDANETGTPTGDSSGGTIYASADTHISGHPSIFHKPSISMRIRAFSTKPENTQVYDAALIKGQITSRYGIALQ